MFRERERITAFSAENALYCQSQVKLMTKKQWQSGNKKSQEKDVIASRKTIYLSKKNKHRRCRQHSKIFQQRGTVMLQSSTQSKA
jgi:hypothetical protein